MRICSGAKEAIHSRAVAHGVTEVALVDALVHALASADPAWLQVVVGHARKIDAQRRCRDQRAGASVLRS